MEKVDLIKDLEIKLNLKFSKVEYNENDYNLSSNVYSLDESKNIILLHFNGHHQSKKFDQNLLKDFVHLKYLGLTNMGLEDVDLTPYKNLRILFLGGNKITNISSIEHNKQLRILALWGNEIDNIDPISKLLDLEEIYFQNCNIYNLNFIKDLIKLRIASFKGNNIEDISIIENFPNTAFDFIDNLITEIPYEVARNNDWLENSLIGEILYNNGDINLHDSPVVELALGGNTLIFPPNSVIELGKKNTYNYYDAFSKFGSSALSEGRIIVVGDGSCGKSSLIERIIFDSFESGKLQTNGVKIQQWKPLENSELIFNFWDFGGQEIQHAVHRFFFTEGCLYILVLDNRKEEDPEYWLRQIESLGGNAPVLIIFNKHDENQNEIADKKYLKDKYNNIVNFYNISCLTNFGIKEFKEDLNKEAIKLNTVYEKFPNNWLNIKRLIENITSNQHYISYEQYVEMCKENNVNEEDTQKLLLKYFTTIGATTWFGDTFLNFLHVLSPAWITEAVYKILTSKKTSTLLGNINITDFKELLAPTNESDYLYDEHHYGYILSMMKKFDLCYTPDDKTLLLPSAFGKMPKIEYSDFRGEDTRSYIFQFKDYIPVSIIHRIIAKQLQDAFDGNFWYSGIVVKDRKNNSLAMIHLDKEDKRIYVRIKGESKLGTWEYIRRDFDSIVINYPYLTYTEQVILTSDHDYTVEYDDLINHISASKSVYFHPKLRKDFNVGYLIGLFESKENTLEKFRKSLIDEEDNTLNNKSDKILVNILNNNSPHIDIQSNINISVNVDIDINIVNDACSEIRGEIEYILENIKPQKKVIEAFDKMNDFLDDCQSSKNKNQIKEKGWGRRLKNVFTSLSENADKIKKIDDGGTSLLNMIASMKILLSQFDLKNASEFLSALFS